MAFIDTFTEAALTNLESHTPDTGTAWTLVSGPGPAQISGGTGWLRAKTATASVYACDDQGSANNYVEVVYNLQADTPDCIVASRLVDSNNAIGWEMRGTGSVGGKLTKLVGGVATYLISYQGVDNSTARVECDGTTIRLYDGGVQVGTDQTVSDFSTETTQGLIVKKNANVDWLDSFEAGVLGGGSSTNLIIADAAHGHAADGLVLTGDSTLAIADSTHAHSADVPVLTTDSVLAILGVLHAHLADGLVLTSEHLLAVADVSHAHLADSLTLSDSPSLAVAEATHAHASDSPVLTLDSTLAIADAYHAHLSYSLSLIYGASLEITGSLHAHYADGLVLALPVFDGSWPDPGVGTFAWPSGSGGLAWPAPSGGGAAWP